MSLNSISLSPSLLVSFYERSLVQNIASPVPFLGENAKNILAVVNCTDVPFLPDTELQFLTNVLSACGLGLSDVAIVNWQNRAGNSPVEILEQTAARQIFLFGLKPEMFGVDQPLPLHSVSAEGPRQYISTLSLAELENDQPAKKQFWLALKQLFGI